MFIDLRTLNLLEADFNFNNKVMAKTTLECAERNRILQPEQHGSRKGLRAILQACNKRLLYNMNHIKRRPMLLCSNVAKSCQDRIVHSIASLALQRAGIPRAPVVSMLQTMQGTEHCIRTVFGDSSITINGRDSDKPYQGMLQGNGSDPVTWALINAPMVDVQRKKGFGVKFATAISKTTDQVI